MASSSVKTILVFACFELIVGTDQVCEVANVHIENEDGSHQVFELKNLEPAQSGAYVLCSNRQGQHTPAGPAPWTESALRFNVMLTPGEVVTACEAGRDDLPPGLCSLAKTDASCTNEGVCLGTSDVSAHDLADEIISRNLLPFASGDRDVDHRVAKAIVSINSGQWEKAIKELNELLTQHHQLVAGHYARGVAYARKGLDNPQYAVLSLADFTVCVEKERTQPEAFERRAEVYIALNQFQKALEDLNIAIALRPTSRLRFSRGIVNLLLENFADAETDFKKNLDDEKTENSPLRIMSYFHLGLAQYYRGRLRNAIEVFKEVLKLQPDHIEACVSLAQAFRELGNLRAAGTRFDQALALSPNHTLALQLKGSMLYHSGDPASARPVLRQCLTIAPDSLGCQYMFALSNIAVGHYYQGVKATTKVMVKSLPLLQSTPEYVRAQYLREYARFLHSSLDMPLNQLQPEVGLDENFRAQWVQGVAFKPHGTYREQPGLQPDIKDVSPDLPEDWAKPSDRTLLCFAEKVGLSMQVAADGFLPNRRLNLAMGLAAIHIAQHAEAKWKSMKAGKTEKPFSWKELFSIAVWYRRLVDPEQPVLWINTLPDYQSEDGHREDITFIRGSVTNTRVSQYFDLAFKLARTMLEHYAGAGTVTYPGLATDLEKAKTCEDLLAVARKRHINPHGFLVSTQVPTAIAQGSSSAAGEDRLDGTVLVLTEDPQGRIVFALSIASKPSRTAAYAAQMDHFLLQLHQEVQRTGLGKLSDLDPVLSAILSLVYYFYNLMPLTRGSSVVAYAVALGLIMSLGRQVSGKLPTGKLLDMEAMLSGAPDAFIMVSRQWMNVKKSTTPLSSMPKVWDRLPTVRSLLEVLALNTTTVCG
ncbi:hypothetical protein BaRGS_00000509 [Batillaria attramentaria]|uniref:Uncharacterized protein n=1 Tax=Batillaria attramentaria TaxID=370345 RepID=A0ABD0M9E8_9CAEN